MKAAPLLLLFAGLAWSPPLAADPPPAFALSAPIADDCKSSDPHEVVVCGRSQQRYRIDPIVLAATRAAEAPPPKPPLDASRDTSCIGANCGGGTIPLVGMALTALKAAELAADGDDWREAFRTRPDQYQEYQEEKAKEAARSHIAIGVSAGNKGHQ